MDTFQHRPTGSKQQNKSFKSGKHRSKGEIKQKTQGKVNKERLAGFKSNAKTLQESKQARKLKAKQLQQNKRQAMMMNNRIGVGDTPPRIVAIIGLTPNARIDAFSQDLITHLLQTDPQCSPQNLDAGKKIGGTTLIVNRFKTRLTLFPCADRDIVNIIDISKVADLVLFVSNAQDILIDEAVADPLGLKIISLIKEQTMPEVIGAVQDLDKIQSKLRGQCKKACQEFFERQIQEKTKVQPIDSEADLAQMIRFVCSEPVIPLAWRNLRPYMLVDNINWEPYPDQTPFAGSEKSFGTLYVSGYLRGNKLNVDNILHLTGYGDVQIEKVIGGIDPYSAKPALREKSEQMTIENEGVQVVRYDMATADPINCETLVRENTPDPFASEMTWPTPEELAEAEKDRNFTKKVPAGTNPYQAAWIPDFTESSEEEGEDSDGDMTIKDETQMDGDQQMDTDQQPKKAVRAVSFADHDDTINMTDTVIKEQSTAEDWVQEELEDEMFPDEVDTPVDVPARVRFQKYRGLKSFRTTPWDPKQNLPFDYAKIFQFQNFKRTFNKVLRDHDGLRPHQYITLAIKNVAHDQFASHPNGRPLLASGLFKYENKVSVLNLTIHRVPTYTEPMKTKIPILVQAGFRRFEGSPVYSEYNLNGDKFKSYKFLRGTGIASFYGPVCFPPTPVLYFSGADFTDLVGFGGVHSVNPDHIIVKKLILSGIPIRVNKAKGTIKKMFWHPDDVRYFKPIELWTKYGRSGRIIEPVGTHGEMKCGFDSALTQQDTIMMSLYKRIYPQWVKFQELEQPKQPEQQ